MARPRYRENDETALDRIENAFWTCLEEEPYAKMTISRIVRTAGVNRNTFYYHYRDVDDMAHRIVREKTLDPAFARIVLAQIGQGADVAVGELPSVKGLELRFDHICLIAGDNGSPELRRILKDAILRVWSETFSIDFDTLAVEELALIEFMIGGVMAVLAFRMDGHKDFTIAGVDDPQLRQLLQQNYERLCALSSHQPTS